MDVINLNFIARRHCWRRGGRKIEGKLRLALLFHIIFLPHAEMIMAYGDGVVGEERRAQQATENIAII